ncbi:MAG TPA: hypothetical protein VFI06_15400 [Chitinophagaceae bacterium]|nr:hypothetical protein [Chitinophagaceae bacterium]
MKILAASAAVVIFSITAFNPSSFTKQTSGRTPKNPVSGEQKIQVAILLDVSNSMDGLIEQAKAQLWNMVTVMSKTKCETGNPKIEIALYEYGRTDNDAQVGYVKQISGFSSDLDQLSMELFKLTTNGGDEYCGQVIYTSLEGLQWDPSPSSYKTIFIAGNEDFWQGKVSYTKACEEARKKGVIVNTIYCGDREMGIQEHWNLSGECGNGSFTNINQDAKIEDIPTPYDSTLITLNYRLNSTYLYYGERGALNYEHQRTADNLNAEFGNTASVKRVQAKSMVNGYVNYSWDLVDASRADSNFFKKVEIKTLPDSLKNKSREEIRETINKKATERLAIQTEIQRVSNQRTKYLFAERAKSAANNNTPTLESEVEKIIRTQVKRFKMKID